MPIIYTGCLEDLAGLPKSSCRPRVNEDRQCVFDQAVSRALKLSVEVGRRPSVNEPYLANELLRGPIIFGYRFS